MHASRVLGTSWWNTAAMTSCHTEPTNATIESEREEKAKSGTEHRIQALIRIVYRTAVLAIRQKIPRRRDHSDRCSRRRLLFCRKGCGKSCLMESQTFLFRKDARLLITMRLWGVKSISAIAFVGFLIVTRQGGIVPISAVAFIRLLIMSRLWGIELISAITFTIHCHPGMQNQQSQMLASFRFWSCS